MFLPVSLCSWPHGWSCGCNQAGRRFYYWDYGWESRGVRRWQASTLQCTRRSCTFFSKASIRPAVVAQFRKTYDACARPPTDRPSCRVSSFRHSCTIWFRLARSWTIWFRLAPIEDMDSTKRESHHGAIVVSVASSSPSSQHIARNFESERPCPSTIFWTMGSSPSIGRTRLQKTRTR
jgi:hypothetical protein